MAGIIGYGVLMSEADLCEQNSLDDAYELEDYHKDDQLKILPFDSKILVTFKSKFVNVPSPGEFVSIPDVLQPLDENQTEIIKACTNATPTLMIMAYDNGMNKLLEAFC